jgi:hypothetical protein
LAIDAYTWQTAQMLGEIHHLENGVLDQSAWHAFLEDHKPELEVLCGGGRAGPTEPLLGACLGAQMGVAPGRARPALARAPARREGE